MGDTDTLEGQEPIEPADEAGQIEASQDATAAAEGAEERPQEPKYVTADDLREMEERIVKRTKQSYGDQISTKIQQQLQQYNAAVALQEKAGVKVPPEDQAKVRANILQDGLAGEQSQQQAAGLTDDQWASYVATQAEKVMERVGVEVKRGDPEWAGVEKSYKDPNLTLAELLIDIHDAAVTKKARLEKNKQGAGARVLKGAGPSISPGDISQVTDTAELYEMGEKQMRGAKQ